MNWFNDDDLESTNAHWKNSEIMRSFVENYLDDKLAEPTEQKSDVDLDNIITNAALEELGWPADENISIQEVVNFYKIAKANEELDDVIKTLGNLATESTKYGNEKATYMIERTIEEVRALKDGE